MGFFDLPSPAFAWVDQLLQLLPPTLRLVLWALIGASLSMYLYLKMSSQEKIGDLKTQATAARKKLSAYDGTEMDEMMPLAMNVLKLSGKHFYVVTGPAILSSLPALCLIVFISNAYGYIFPDAGSTVEISATPVDATLSIDSDTAQRSETGYQVVWPGEGQSLNISDASGSLLVTLPAPAPTPVIHKRQWWNSLIGNPAGYLDEDAAINELFLAMPEHRFIGIGPSWIQTWEFTFFIALLIFSLGIKVVFKIH
jgi:hypothetical protein